MTSLLFAATSIHDFSLKSIDGQDLPLSSHKGKAVLLVTTASRCGHTPQHNGLGGLHPRSSARMKTKLSRRGSGAASAPAPEKRNCRRFISRYCIQRVYGLRASRARLLRAREESQPVSLSANP